MKSNNQSTRDRSFSSSSSKSKSVLQPSVSRAKPNLNVDGIVIIPKSQFKKDNFCFICLVSLQGKWKPQNCRICGSSVCELCSSGKLNNERSCDICYQKQSQNGVEDKQKKAKVIETLEILCSYLIRKKQLKSLELQKLRQSNKHAKIQQKSSILTQKQSQDSILKNLQLEAAAIQQKKKIIQQQLIKQQLQTKALQNKFSQIQSQLITN